MTIIYQVDLSLIVDIPLLYWYNIYMSETKNYPFTFSEYGGKVEAFSPNVHLSGGDSINFSLSFKKEPTDIQPGMTIEWVEFDKDNQLLSDVWEQIDRIKKLAEDKRPRKVMELLRSKVQYPYDWILESLTLDNPNQAQWVRENIAIEPYISPYLKLSDIVTNGYATCRHFAASYLFLAHEAGLTVAFSTNSPDSIPGGGPGPIRNVRRRDDGEQLFKSCAAGQPIWAGHAWAEVRINDKWIPVDPTTNLVGDREDDFNTFFDADYRAASQYSLSFSDDLPDIYFFRHRDLDFPVGQSVHRGTFSLNCVARQKPLSLNPEKQAQYDKEEWPKPTEWKGPLRFVVGSAPIISGLNVSVLGVRED